jgi:LysM repeat protein
MRSSAALLLLISCFFAKFAQSQSNELLIQGQTGNLYLEHTVVAKENWYSVGRMFNIDPKALAPFNHSALTQPLMIGQLLQIPLTGGNFSQNGQKAPSETLVPVIHIIQDKEWLYRVSVNHNKVPVTSLEKWNNTTPEQVYAGMHLIVGYLRVKTSQSALAKMPVTPAVATAASAVPPQPSTSSPGDGASAVPANASSVPPGASAVPSATTASAAPAITKPAPTVEASDGDADSSVSRPLVSKTPVSTAPAPTMPAPHFNGGTFRSDFNDGGHAISGNVGVFKSTSGWQDGKYYALMNNATVGAIVKITDQSSGKSVYAKILGTLPDMKESVGLTIRISNAAAAELGEGEGRFNAQVSY